MRKAGYKSRRKVRADIQAGALHPYISIHDYGIYADAEVRKWLGLRSWEECWGTEPRIAKSGPAGNGSRRFISPLRPVGVRGRKT